MPLDTESFVGNLSQVSLPNIFNQYKDVCLYYDSKNSPLIRRENLKNYLKVQLEKRPKNFWVGEAGGYKGVRRTGLLLTSENWLSLASLRLETEFKKATVTDIQKELSAGAVWREIERLNEVPFVWAAVPLHVHQPKKQLSNRNPIMKEVRFFYPFLEEILQTFKPKNIVAIGRIAQKALLELGIRNTYVRHPSMAGIPEFRRGIHRLYNIK